MTDIPRLAKPFSGDYPITFTYGAQPESDAVVQRYASWGIRGHNGIDYATPQATPVLSVDKGTIIQAGANSDYGISITIKHSWGTSFYAHLEGVRVDSSQKVKKGDTIGTSGSSGFSTGPHLHFGIKPHDVDTDNGYLGFIDPSGFFINEKFDLVNEEAVANVIDRTPAQPEMNNAVKREVMAAITKSRKTKRAVTKRIDAQMKKQS